MVVTCASLPTVLSAVTHDRLVTPLMITVHAPHCATPQPNLTPFVPTWLRRTYSNGSVPSVTVTVVSWLFTYRSRVKGVAIKRVSLGVASGDAGKRCVFQWG